MDSTVSISEQLSLGSIDDPDTLVENIRTISTSKGRIRHLNLLQLLFVRVGYTLVKSVCESGLPRDTYSSSVDPLRIPRTNSGSSTKVSGVYFLSGALVDGRPMFPAGFCSIMADEEGMFCLCVTSPRTPRTPVAVAGWNADNCRPDRYIGVEATFPTSKISRSVSKSEI